MGRNLWGEIRGNRVTFSKNGTLCEKLNERAEAATSSCSGTGHSC